MLGPSFLLLSSLRGPGRLGCASVNTGAGRLSSALERVGRRELGRPPLPPLPPLPPEEPGERLPLEGAGPPN